MKWPLSRGRRRENTTVLGSQVSPSASTGHNTVKLPKTSLKMFGASHCTQHWHPCRRATTLVPINTRKHIDQMMSTTIDGTSVLESPSL